MFRFIIISFSLTILASVVFAKPKTITIFSSNDTHTRYLGYGPNEKYTPDKLHDGTIGGIARFATLLDLKRNEAKKTSDVVLTLDAGDFTVGTLFHTITRETGSELQFFGLLGYDATCIGNHEFDLKISGLVSSIKSAHKLGHSIPPILSSNIVFSGGPEDKELSHMMDQGILRRYLVIERGGVKIGLFGILGNSAVEVTTWHKPLVFKDSVKTSQEMVEFLKNEKKVDLVIALSHSGVHQKEDGSWGGEDIAIAQGTPGLDVIVGGHSHTAVEKEIIVNQTIIVQAGSEYKYLGELKLEIENKKARVLNYHLNKVDSNILGKKEITEKVNELKALVEKNVLKSHSFDKPIAFVEKNHGRTLNDHLIGNLVTASYQAAAKSDFAFTANGNLRDDLYAGEQSVDDIFRVLSIGIGETDNEPGHPLVKIYLTSQEIKNMIEVLLIAYKVKNNEDFYPRFWGIKFLYNTYRVPFDMVSEVLLGNPKKGFSPINLQDEKKLYSVATTSYVGSFVWLIKKLSFGLLSVVPKDVNGRVLSHLDEAIVKNPVEPLKEEKAWKAFLTYIVAMKGHVLNMIPYVAYEKEWLASPMEQVNTLSPLEYFKNSSWISWAVWLLAGVLLLGIIFLSHRFLFKR